MAHGVTPVTSSPLYAVCNKFVFLDPGYPYARIIILYPEIEKA
jgi:hypothetical protein